MASEGGGGGGLPAAGSTAAEPGGGEMSVEVTMNKSYGLSSFGPATVAEPAWNPGSTALDESKRMKEPMRDGAGPVLYNTFEIEEATSYELRDARDLPGASAKRLKPILTVPRFSGLTQMGLDTPLAGSGKIKLKPVGSETGSDAGAALGSSLVKSGKRRAPMGATGAKAGGKVETQRGGTAQLSNDIEAQIEHITTGDQVVEFYARYGQSSGVKFFYCNQQPPGQLLYRPYELEVCDRLDVNPESYFTMSAGGVVNVCRGKETEFTALGDFMRDKSIFNALTRMKFFKHYANYKAFHFWRSNVRKKLFNQVRARLVRKLFLAKPTFCPALMEINSLVHEITEVKVINASPNHLYTLDEYAEQQKAQREQKALPALESCCERAQAVLEKLCREVTAQAKLYQESIRDEAELEDKTGVQLISGRPADKTRSMVAIKAEKIERARTYHRVNEEAKMLGDFIKLVDYMLVEGTVKRAVTTAEELLTLLEAPKKRAEGSAGMSTSKGVFITTLAFTETTLSFTPPCEDVLAVINNTVIEGMINLIQAVPRLLYMRVFAGFFDGSPAGKGLNPVSIVRSTDYFQKLLQGINEVVTEDFKSADEYAQIFEDQRVIYEFGKTWDVEEYRTRDRDLGTYRQDMNQQREWKQVIERMKIGNVVGVLSVDSRSLRNSLLPVTTKTIDDIKALLLDSARDEAAKVLASYTELNATLSKRPEDLDDFVGFGLAHAEAVENRASQVEAATTVDEMYELLKVYEVKVPTKDQVVTDDLTDAVAVYATNMESANSYIEERKQSMMTALDQNITATNDELLAILGNLHSGVVVEPDNDPAKMVGELETIQASIDDLAEKVQQFQSYQKTFHMPVDDFSNLHMTDKECKARAAVWRTLYDFQKSVSTWTTGPVKALNAEDIAAEMDRVTVEAYKMGKANKEDRVVFRIRDEMEVFKEKLPMIEELANAALKDRHWQDIFALIEQQYNPDEPFSLESLLEFKLDNKIEDVARISTNASKEHSLEKALEKMVEDWDGIDFRCIAYKDTGTFILGGVDDVQMILDDQIVKIQSMRASPFIKPFEATASNWDETLQTLQDMLDNWLLCQSTWQYLEPIFSSEDIMKQMPEEGSKFQTVDQIYREIMEKTEKVPGALEVARDKARLEDLEEANQLLDAIQKGLASYLEVKRIAFPRFFFLSNDEMLEILSETKDPTKVQPHLKKCFEGINEVQFDDNVMDIIGMNSVEGEFVPYITKITPAKANGAVEKWLVQVESSMLEAIRDSCKKSNKAYAESVRTEWVTEWPGQIVLVISAVYWTSECATAIASEAERKGSVKAYADTCTEQLMKIVDLVRGDLSKLNRKTISALVVMDVHARDVVENMAAKGVASEADFEWLSQLRMYLEEDAEGEETVMERMMNAEIEYGYEYLGNSSRLVITPLTDRCYRTLMGAIHLNMGGAPEGPAGTGKTETTKDLAKALARQCVVFNCSDSLDYLTMAKFFKGLASSGAWACFDEFNRIDLEVLSVVAQQVLEIQIAVKNKVKTFVFEGSELPLRVTCNVFITMNPGYAGRSELPDNLKALFRTVAMMVPDYALISEILLYSDGYLKARDCARKIVATYKLCSEQLSSQDHYDYGMRAVIAVLRAAGNLKRTFPEEEEFVLMLRSIIDVNLCKFLSHDVPLFNGIVSDLFPGVVLPEPDYKNLTAAMTTECKKLNLQPHPYFFEKCIQLYEMIVVRHGLMVVGLSFSGKSAAIKVLSGALITLNEQGLNDENKVDVIHLNPKSVTMGQLYGETDKATQEWKDGVLAVQFRKLSQQTGPNRKWLVLDGPVDAIWIENMNTVLDDNKKLCLPNSEIIAMTGSMNMIFEVADLAVASPATVSRCGMVYLEPHQLGWKPLFMSWLDTLDPSLGPKTRERITGLFDWLLPPALRIVKKRIKEMSPVSESNLATSLMRLFKALLADLTGIGAVVGGDDDGLGAAPAAAEGEGEEAEAPPVQLVDDEAMAPKIDSIFVFSIIWAVGGSTDAKGRAVFDKTFRELLTGAVPDEDLGLFIPEEHLTLTSAPVPDTDGTSLYDYCLNKEDCTKWELWTDTITEAERTIPSGSSFGSIIVPTNDSARYTFLLDNSLRHDYPVLFCGPTGTGKSVYIQRHLKSLDKDKFTPTVIGFSARTTANMTQEQVDGRLDKRRKGIYGPPPGRKAFFFVDDLNMPAREVYGAQPPIEILRQFMDYRGWYGRDNVFRSIVDIQFLTAMGPAGGGRNMVTDRFLRHFNLVGVAEVADSTLQGIFETILQWYFKDGSFSTGIQALVPKVVSATLEIYNACLDGLLPTPAKSHYTFNLRDLARVVQGMMLCKNVSMPEGKDAEIYQLRLWIHETMRVFGDRLTDDNDLEWLIGKLKNTTKTVFDEDFDTMLAHLDSNGDAVIDPDDMRRCVFGNYMDIEADDEPDGKPRLYEEVRDTEKLISIMEEYLVDHNGMSKRPMNLAMFLYTAEHISRIVRVLSQPGGNLLCVGVGGSGRQSLTRLSAHICGMQVIQVEISKTYGVNEWREDLKKMLRMSGGEGKNVVFLFSDSQIKTEVFVEDINNILNSGEVPNMFPNDEKMAVLEMVRQPAAKLGLESQLELWSFFTQRCKEMLHICFCMSPIGDAFRERLRQFPSLVNCCTIDWFKAWPKDALEAVASKFLKEIDLQDDVRERLMLICQRFHSGVRDTSEKFLAEQGRHNYVTPTSYLELLTAFNTLLTAKRAETSKMKSRYEVGLEKIASAAEQVAGMQNELEALKPQLIKTVGEVEVLMAQIAKEKTEVVEPKKIIAQQEEAVAAEGAAKAKAVKDECEGMLAEAMPILNDAISALDTLKPADINYVKGLKNPPAAIKLVMEAVCVILDVKPAKAKDDSGKSIDDYWKPSLGLLNDKDFLNTLKNYDKDNIPPKIITKIREKYIANEDFTPEKAANASAAAEGMCKWVCAMDKYEKVAKLIKPKQEALAEAEAEYNELMVGLKKTQAELQALVDKLDAMEAELSENTAKKNQLEADVDLCTVKLERAEKLIAGLGGEKDRWTEEARLLGIRYTNLTGDILVCAGVISYLGAFTMNYRTEIAAEWVELCAEQDIPRSQTFSLNQVLGNPVQIREWLIAGLPNDSFSIDNGIIVDNARRWPLMIDPQGQANKWVRNMERANNLQVIKLSEGGEYLRTLENAIQFGLPVLLENVGEELDPSLEPLLLKQVFKSGGMNCIRLGDSTIEYSSDFRFYITTKLRNPHYLPETAVKVTLLNFMITLDGLSDQLLGVVVAKERPDLEEAKNNLVIQSAANKKKLKEIEDKILEVLSSSEGNILEDESAITIISDAKVVSNEIAVAQEEADKTEKEIDEARMGYKPSGEYTAVLFFTISDLAEIEPMYQYSLSWFVNLFIASIAAATPSDDVPTRLENIKDHFTYSLYCNICRSLFEKDKLLFAFLLCSRIMGAQGKIDSTEWLFLLTGGLGSGVDVARPDAEWVTTKCWNELTRLSKLKAFKGIAEHFSATHGSWKVVYDHDSPHTQNFPDPWTKLDEFQKLLVMRCIRPDKVVPAVFEFVNANMGERFVSPPPFNLRACYDDSSAVVPLVFVLSAGSDPMAALLQFAEEKDMSMRINYISLGQGQGPKAAAMIKEGLSAGNWVVLQNCHLAPSWMPALDKICEDFDPETANADFRLWMTAYPSPKFPVTILQNSVKMTNEPPKGIRANMLRSLQMEPIVNAEFFDGCSKPKQFKAMLFGLCFFHANVQERRKFGPLGWNIPYGFDDGDMRISVRQLRMFIDENDELPLAALRYATGECNYGGRVTDDKDRILLNSLLEKCYCTDIVENPDYKLTESGLYHSPCENPTVEQLTSYIQGLPILPLPEAFGMHANADITKDQADTAIMCNSLLLMSGSGGGGGGGGAEEQTAAAVEEFLSILPANFDIEATQRKWPIQYEESMNTVLAQEMSRFNKLLNVIRNSLNAIKLAIAGLSIMSSENDAAYRSLAVGEIPALWKGASYPSLKPVASYMSDLIKRLEMLQTWCDTGIPSVFWISGFYFVQSFLTAALQNYARANKFPIDEVSYDFQPMEMDPTQYKEGPKDGVYIRGLFIEGCDWDPTTKRLCESKPKMLFVDAPVFWLVPKLTTEHSNFQHYNCPIYRTQDRRGVLATTGHSTNFVMFLRVPTDKPSTHWTMRGVAFITTLAD